MKRKELDALKAALREQSEKATDMETLAERLLGRLEGLLHLLPEEARAILEKYQRKR